MDQQLGAVVGRQADRMQRFGNDGDFGVTGGQHIAAVIAENNTVAELAAGKGFVGRGGKGADPAGDRAEKFIGLRVGLAMEKHGRSPRKTW